MKLDEFDYQLPKNLIAQFPLDKRDESALMTLSRTDKTIGHKKFFDLPELLSENDVLVMNNTKVIPARFLGKKKTGANIEVFLLEKDRENVWTVLVKPAKRVKEGTEIVFSDELKAKIVSREDYEKWKIEFFHQGDFEEIINRVGNMPLPPYIDRESPDEKTKSFDMERYQTIYAQKPGSVAAPTAGLHFTETVLNKIKENNIEILTVTLNVGLGTFKPVRAENILEHKMDREYYEIEQKTAERINKAKRDGKNIVAVGTTTVRTLESASNITGDVSSLSGWSDLFIYPGYKFKIVDKLITNFHLPKSTLLMLVSAFAGKEFVFNGYKEAVDNNYRFYSYGDCMFIF